MVHTSLKQSSLNTLSELLMLKLGVKKYFKAVRPNGLNVGLL
jgi:hypothetical protein